MTARDRRASGVRAHGLSLNIDPASCILIFLFFFTSYSHRSPPFCVASLHPITTASRPDIILGLLLPPHPTPRSYPYPYPKYMLHNVRPSPGPQTPHTTSSPLPQSLPLLSTLFLSLHLHNLVASLIVSGGRIVARTCYCCPTADLHGSVERTECMDSIRIIAVNESRIRCSGYMPRV